MYSVLSGNEAGAAHLAVQRANVLFAVMRAGLGRVPTGRQIRLPTTACPPRGRARVRRARAPRSRARSFPIFFSDCGENPTIRVANCFFVAVPYRYQALHLAGFS